VQADIHGFGAGLIPHNDPRSFAEMLSASDLKILHDPTPGGLAAMDCSKPDRVKWICSGECIFYVWNQTWLGAGKISAWYSELAADEMESQRRGDSATTR
jgi:hypothetical protein